MAWDMAWDEAAARFAAFDMSLISIIRLLDDTRPRRPPSPRQGSGLVKANRGDVGQALEGLTTPEQDSLARCVAESTPHRQRRGQPQSARTGDQA